MKLKLIALTVLLVACGQPDFYLPPTSRTDTGFQVLENKYGLSLRPLMADEPNFPWWLRVMVSYKPDTITTSSKDSPYQPSYLYPEALDTELSKYPENFFRNGPVDSILWVSELKGTFQPEGRISGGLAYQLFNQRRVFITSGSSFAYILHHELFHAVDDFFLSGNPDFLRCNPPGFKYGLTSTSWGNYPQPGFVSGYAQARVSEDQAEIAAMMIASTKTAHLLDSWIANGDTMLACKREAVRKYLAERFPAFNSAYWALVTFGIKGDQLISARKDPTSLRTLDNTRENFIDPLNFEAYQTDAVKAIPFRMSAAIGQLSGLRVLKNYLAYTQLPEELAQLSQLENLSLDQAPFTALPAVISRLTALKTLSLAQTKLVSAVPLPQPLESLNLGFANIKPAELEAFFAAQPQVKYLKLMLETQTELPTAIGRMTQLENLTLYMPGLKRLPDWLLELKSLKRLRIYAPDLEPFNVPAGMTYNRLDGFNWFDIQPDLDQAVFGYPDVSPSEGGYGYGYGYPSPSESASAQPAAR